MGLTFQMRGRTFDEDQMSVIARQSAKPTKRKTADTSRGYHKGWRVVGVKPGVLEDARRVANEEIARYQALTVKKGYRKPKPFDEVKFLQTARRSSVRSKPYELEQAARLCKEMAEKEGWLCVELVEVKREPAKQ